MLCTQVENLTKQATIVELLLQIADKRFEQAIKHDKICLKSMLLFITFFIIKI